VTPEAGGDRLVREPVVPPGDLEASLALLRVEREERPPRELHEPRGDLPALLRRHPTKRLDLLPRHHVPSVTHGAPAPARSGDELGRQKRLLAGKDGAHELPLEPRDR